MTNIHILCVYTYKSGYFYNIVANLILHRSINKNVLAPSLNDNKNKKTVLNTLICIKNYQCSLKWYVYLIHLYDNQIKNNKYADSLFMW